HYHYRCLNLPADAQSLDLTDENGEAVIELRCQPTQQTMVPPSLWVATKKKDAGRQPDRLRYFTDAREPQEADFALVKQVVRAAFAAVCTVDGEPDDEAAPKSKKKKRPLPPPSLALLQDVVNAIPSARMTYEKWIKVGMALKNCCGGDKKVSDAQGF